MNRYHLNGKSNKRHISFGDESFMIFVGNSRIEKKITEKYLTPQAFVIERVRLFSVSEYVCLIGMISKFLILIRNLLQRSFITPTSFDVDELGKYEEVEKNFSISTRILVLANSNEITQNQSNALNAVPIYNYYNNMVTRKLAAKWKQAPKIPIIALNNV